MQVPLLNGAYTDVGAEFRTSYPRNLIPVIKDTGISKLFLRSAEGLTRFDNGAVTLTGTDRGGINWKNICYRVIGTNFVSVSAAGAITVLGQLPDDGNPVKMTRGYTNQGIGIVCAKLLYFYTVQTPSGSTQGSPTLQQCTDPNVGSPIDIVWMAGYFVLTDGTDAYNTNLANQFTINSQEFGSDSNSPDPINGLFRFRNELYVGNRYTIAVMDNEGGTGFPFVENEGATIPKGIIGPYAHCMTSQGFAFVGGDDEEAPSVWLSVGLGIATKIASREIETVMGTYTEEQLNSCTLEYRGEKNAQLIYLHLIDHTFVYDVVGSQMSGEQIWFVLDSSSDGTGAWRGWHPVYCYGKFIYGDKLSAQLAFLDRTTAQQFGNDARWQFDSIFAYNAGNGVAVELIELIGTYGRVALGANPSMSMQYSNDGKTWSAPRFVAMGGPGNTLKRPQWRPKNFFRNFRSFRFAGYNASPISFASLEFVGEKLG
jgi:hypothetical protein